MASTVVPTIETDTVISLEINPGTLLQFLETRPEGGPRLKCVEGRVTLVSPGLPHERMGCRLSSLILAVCLELGIKLEGLGSTTWTLPLGSDDTAYEADHAYYIQSFGIAEPGQRPDLGIEIVVSHSEKKALRAGEILRIPEMWVLDVARHRLTFYHLATRGKHKETYRAQATSLAFPVLTSAEVLERLDDPETAAAAFHENCRAWAREVLVPRAKAECR
ncbi:MAG: Uma2 family endonuclease [Isosphaeraceae bacterium]